MRAFIAFDLQSQDKEKITKIQSDFKSLVYSKVSYTKESQFHITSFFLGEISEALADKIIALIKNAEIKAPFDLNFEKIDYFPDYRNPRIIVLKSKAPEEMEQLVKSMDKSLNKLAFERDKKWIPHITLGRAREKLNKPDINIDSFLVKISSISLYKSVLSPQGPVYQKIFSREF